MSDEGMIAGGFEEYVVETPEYGPIKIDKRAGKCVQNWLEKALARADKAEESIKHIRDELDIMADNGIISRSRAAEIMGISLRDWQALGRDAEAVDVAKVIDTGRQSDSRVLRVLSQGWDKEIARAEELEAEVDRLRGVIGIREAELDGKNPFEAWRKWFRENCSEWNEIEDIEAELAKNRSADDDS